MWQERSNEPEARQSRKRVTRAALGVAKDLGFSSIAIPGMGTGVGGVPVNKAAETMIRTVRQCLLAGTPLKHIFLVSTDKSLTDAFESHLR